MLLFSSLDWYLAIVLAIFFDSFLVLGLQYSIRQLSAKYSRPLSISVLLIEITCKSIFFRLSNPFFKFKSPFSFFLLIFSSVSLPLCHIVVSRLFSNHFCADIPVFSSLHFCRS